MMAVLRPIHLYTGWVEVPFICMMVVLRTPFTCMMAVLRPIHLYTGWVEVPFICMMVVLRSHSPV
jgi:hypothetical protein